MKAVCICFKKKGVTLYKDQNATEISVADPDQKDPDHFAGSELFPTDPDPHPNYSNFKIY